MPVFHSGQASALSVTEAKVMWGIEPIWSNTCYRYHPFLKGRIGKWVFALSEFSFHYLPQQSVKGRFQQHSRKLLEGGPIPRSSNCLEGLKNSFTSRAHRSPISSVNLGTGLSNGRLRKRLKNRILERCPLSAIVRLTTFAMSVTWRSSASLARSTRFTNK